MDLNGKRALVTGGSRGIGAAIAIDLAAHGADVVINGRHQNDAAETLLQEISAHNAKGHFVSADMSNEDEITRCVAQAVETLGGLDILIHSAGGPAWGRIEDVDFQSWRETFAVHVDAAFHLCRFSLPHLRASGGGAIVLVSSVAGIRGVPGAVPYGTAKGAVLQLARMLARDLADENIRVNCVAPGIIRTRFHDNMTSEQQAHNLANRIPLHREGTTADVAEVVRMLLTNEFITGETVVIDGGMSMQIVR